MIKTVSSNYGKQRILDGFTFKTDYPGVYSAKMKEGEKLYIHKRQGSYIITMYASPTIDSMVSLGGEYHFTTLKEIKEAIK